MKKLLFIALIAPLGAFGQYYPADSAKASQIVYFAPEIKPQVNSLHHGLAFLAFSAATIVVGHRQKSDATIGMGVVVGLLSIVHLRKVYNREKCY